MKTTKKSMTMKIVSILLSIIMIAGILPVSVFATENTLMTLEELREQKGAITVEAYNIGQGFLIEPSLYSKGGKSTGDITVDFLTSKNINYKGDTSYFGGFEFDDTVEPQYPSYLEPYLDELDTTGDDDGYLAEFDYSQYSGWCYTINDWWASYGASDSKPGDQITDYNTGEPVALGDVIRWHFTVYGYGADCGFPSNAMAEQMGGNLFTQEDKSDLIFALAAINDYYGNLDTDDVYETALAVAADPLASADDIAAQEAALADYIEDTFLSAGEQEAPREAQDVSAVLNATMAQLAATVTEPAFGTSAGEWTVLSLARGEYFNKDNVYFTDYYNRIVETVNTTAASVNLNGALHKVKSTENSRVILALSSIGKDATAVGDWNLIAPFNDFNWIKKQGINGPIFALIALDTNDYETEDATIRQQCIDFILNAQLEDGGWALSGSTADPDITAMALQALAPYKSQSNVATAAEEAISTLSAIQNSNGGYASWGTVNSESCAQVIVALTTWGINPDTDSRFVKNGKSVVDALLAHYLEDESAFEHVIGSGANGMATDQACYALVAYNRFMNGKTSLYDMSDVTFETVTPPATTDFSATLGLPENVVNVPGTTFNGVVSVNGWNNEGGFKLIDLIVTVPEGLTVTNVTAGSRLVGGTISYNLASDSKLRIVYFDANANSDLTVSGETFPLELFNITFSIENVNVDDVLDIAISDMNLKLTSVSTDNESKVEIETEEAEGSVTVVEGRTFSAGVLYEGDGIDLIPADKKAVVVTVTGLEGTKKLTYNDGTNTVEFKYNAKISEKMGVTAYIALVDADMDRDAFENAENFTIDEADADSITFGDINGDGVINAQDALAAVDMWLRKGDTPTDDEILTANVNGDARIDTYDALAIVEAFVYDDREYAIITKATTIFN